VAHDPTVPQDLHDIQGLLDRFVHLTSTSRQIPPIALSTDIGGVAQDSAAPWSETAAETAFTEAALLPHLMHLAAARNDVKSLEFCLEVSADWEMEDKARVVIPGGIVNCIDPGSNRSPLHVAALNGSSASISRLLKAGALVHLRDNLGHTALYYVSLPLLLRRMNDPNLKQAARQGFADIVDILVSAGANLGGHEYEFGYAALALENALDSGDHRAASIWKKTGMDTTTLKHDVE